jgi:DNA polymerase-3 subunit beta
MEAVILKTHLKEALSRVERCASDSASLPILKSVLLRFGSDEAALSTTNLEIGVTALCTAKVTEAGSFAVPLKIFQDVVSSIPSERIQFSVKNNELSLITESSTATLHCSTADDFPIIPTIEDKSRFFEYDLVTLQDAFSRVIVASHTGEARPELSGVLLNYDIDTMIFAATDVFRLAERKIQKNRFQTTATEPFSCLIPAKTVAEILRLGGTERIKIYSDSTQILFETASFSLVSRLLGGSFPDYEHIIPKKPDAEVVVNRNDFISAIKLGTVVSGKGSEITIRPGSNHKSIEVVSGDQSLGEQRTVLLAKLEGVFEKIGFNGRYFLDGLKALQSEDIILVLHRDNKPALLRDAKDQDYFYLLAPLLQS